MNQPPISTPSVGNVLAALCYGVEAGASVYSLYGQRRKAEWLPRRYFCACHARAQAILPRQKVTGNKGCAGNS